MRKFITLAFSAILLVACTPKMDACECGKRMIDKDSKEALDCKDYWRSLDLKEQEVFMEKAMKCYVNESLGTELK
ncbi:MAG: hypothetical protein K9I97_05765 [Cryomorphaceae bacterium]|nr:hypothetical protein [Cryomorphaceae bacterium]